MPQGLNGLQPVLLRLSDKQRITEVEIRRARKELQGSEHCTPILLLGV
jgi:hypothetical protein